jgi:hypothetical protein
LWNRFFDKQRKDIIVPNTELIDFLTVNKKKQWNYPNTIPNNLWETDWPWSQVNATGTHNYNEIIAELSAVHDLFVEHRAEDKIASYGHEGWYSLTVHGIDYDKTENYDRYGFSSEQEANYKWTSVCDKLPLTKNLIDSLPFKDYGRVRIMRMRPRGYIMPHTDGSGRIFGPFNFAINNPEGCEFVIEGHGVVPFKQGSGFLLDIGMKHAVLNDSEEHRYHIIIHGKLTANPSELLRAML